jgi:hypothetical protein
MAVAASRPRITVTFVFPRDVGGYVAPPSHYTNQKLQDVRPSED